MPVIQRIEYLAEDIEKLIIACLLSDLGSVRVVLFFPVDTPQLKKWVSVVEGVPQRFEIPFRVANHDGRCKSQRASATEPRVGWKIAGSQMIHQKQELMYQLTLRSDIEGKQECSGLESGREIGQQLDKEFGAGKLDGVNCQGVPTDEAKRARYLL